LKLNRVKAAVNGVFMANCPEVTKIVDPVQQFRTKISEAKKLSLGPGRLSWTCWAKSIPWSRSLPGC